MDLVAGILGLLHDLLGAQLGHIQLASQEGGEGSLTVRDDLEVQGVHRLLGGIAVVLVLGQHHLAVVGPLGHGVSAVGAEVLGIGVVQILAALLIELLVDGSQGAEGEHEGSVSGGMLQSDFQGQVVDDLDANLVPLHFAVEVGLGVLDEEQEVGVVGSHLGIQGLLPGKGEVAGGDRITVGPHAILPQMEGVHQLVVGDVHGLGGGGLGSVVLIQHVQLVVHVVDERELVGVGRVQGVHGGGLHADADVQLADIAGRGLFALAGLSLAGLGVAGFAGLVAGSSAAGAGVAAGGRGAVIAAGGEAGDHQHQSQDQSNDLSHV